MPSRRGAFCPWGVAPGGYLAHPYLAHRPRSRVDEESHSRRDAILFESVSNTLWWWYISVTISTEMASDGRKSNGGHNRKHGAVPATSKNKRRRKLGREL